jgi:cytochrome c551/c552
MQAASVEEGEKLFIANCKACHSIETRLVGPALKGITERRDSSWIFKFIQSSQTLMDAGDTTAIQLFNEFNKVMMPDHELSEDQIRSILAYIETGGAPKVNEGEIPRPEVTRGKVFTPLQFGQFKFWLPYTATVLLVIALLYYMVEVNSFNEPATGKDEKDQE